MSTEIQELFARDPLTHTDEEIIKMIEDFRARRAAFNLGAIQAGSSKPAKPKKEPAVSVDLGDLFG